MAPSGLVSSEHYTSHAGVPETASRTAVILSIRGPTTVDRSPRQLRGSESLQNCQAQRTPAVTPFHAHWDWCGCGPSTHTERGKEERCVRHQLLKQRRDSSPVA